MLQRDGSFVLNWTFWIGTEFASRKRKRLDPFLLAFLDSVRMKVKIGIPGPLKMFHVILVVTGILDEDPNIDPRWWRFAGFTGCKLSYFRWTGFLSYDLWNMPYLMRRNTIHFFRKKLNSCSLLAWNLQVNLEHAQLLPLIVFLPFLLWRHLSIIRHRPWSRAENREMTGDTRWSLAELW